jgi:hypothetical protein
MEIMSTQKKVPAKGLLMTLLLWKIQNQDMNFTSHILTEQKSFARRLSQSRS